MKFSVSRFRLSDVPLFEDISTFLRSINRPRVIPSEIDKDSSGVILPCLSDVEIRNIGMDDLHSLANNDLVWLLGRLSSTLDHYPIGIYFLCLDSIVEHIQELSFDLLVKTSLSISYKVNRLPDMLVIRKFNDALQKQICHSLTLNFTAYNKLPELVYSHCRYMTAFLRIGKGCERDNRFLLFILTELVTNLQKFDNRSLFKIISAMLPLRPSYDEIFSILLKRLRLSADDLRYTARLFACISPEEKNIMGKTINNTFKSFLVKQKKKIKSRECLFMGFCLITGDILTMSSICKWVDYIKIAECLQETENVLEKMAKEMILNLVFVHLEEAGSMALLPEGIQEFLSSYKLINLKGMIEDEEFYKMHPLIPLVGLLDFPVSANFKKFKIIRDRDEHLTALFSNPVIIGPYVLLTANSEKMLFLEIEEKIRDPFICCLMREKRRKWLENRGWKYIPISRKEINVDNLLRFVEVRLKIPEQV